MICTSCLETIDSGAAYCQYCGNKTVHIGETTKLQPSTNVSGVRYTASGEKQTPSGVLTHNTVKTDFSFSTNAFATFCLIDGIEHVIINNVVYRRVS